MTQKAHLAPRLRRIRPSPTAEISEKIRVLRAAGRSVINLGEGELDFDTPHHIKDAGIQAILTGETKYTAVSGTKELKGAIIEKFRHENELTYGFEEVIAASGAKQIIFNAFLATIAEGDEVVIPAPYWVSYPDMVRLADGNPCILATGENAGWKIAADALAAAITPRTRWLVLNSPNNPTGAIYSRQELSALAEVLLAHEHVLIMADDIYEHIRYEGEFATIAQVEPRLRERTLTVNGVSKSYSMTGWRIGYAGGPRWLISAIETLQSQSTSNPSSISQLAALEALRGSRDFMAGWLSELAARRDKVVEAVNSAAGLRCATPQGAFYVFVNCAGVVGRMTPDGYRITDDLAFTNYLLEHAGVGTVHGAAFGAPQYIRLAYAVERKLLWDACARIVQACEALS